MKTTLIEIKKEKEIKITALMDKCRMFFAFSNEQFTANKTPKEEGEKYLSLGAGAYLPKSLYPLWIEGMKGIDKWYKGQIKTCKQRNAEILYELCNREAFYTCDISDTFEALGGDYTRAEIQKIYNANKTEQQLQY